MAGVVGGWLLWAPLVLLAAAVGAGLTVSALTDTCGIRLLLARLPYNRPASCDVGAVLNELASQRSTVPTRAA
jgi:hypothetical protein